MKCERDLLGEEDPRRKQFKSNACLVFESLLVSLEFLRKHGGIGNPDLESRCVKWKAGKLGKEAAYAGKICFVGRTHFALGIWIGIRLDTPDGKNNGTINDTKYFSCKSGHGLFCKPSQITLTTLPFHLDDTQEDADDTAIVQQFFETLKSDKTDAAHVTNDSAISSLNTKNVVKVDSLRHEDAAKTCEEESADRDDAALADTNTISGANDDEPLANKHVPALARSFSDDFDLTASWPSSVDETSDTVEHGHACEVNASSPSRPVANEQEELGDDNDATIGNVENDKTHTKDNIRTTPFSDVEDKGEEEQEDAEGDAYDEHQPDDVDHVLTTSADDTTARDVEATNASPLPSSSPSKRTSVESTRLSSSSTSALIFEPTLDQNEQWSFLSSPEARSRKVPAANESSIDSSAKVSGDDVVAQQYKDEKSETMNDDLKERCTADEENIDFNRGDPTTSVRQPNADYIPNELRQKIEMCFLGIENAVTLKRDAPTIITSLLELIERRSGEMIRCQDELRRSKENALTTRQELDRSKRVANLASKALEESVDRLEPQLATTAQELKRKTRLIELLQAEKSEMKDRVRAMMDNIHKLRSGSEASADVKETMRRQLNTQNKELVRLRVETAYRGGETASQSQAVKKLAEENRTLLEQLRSSENHVLALQKENGALKQHLEDAATGAQYSEVKNEETRFQEETTVVRLREVVKRQSDAIEKLVEENEEASAENNRLVKVVALLRGNPPDSTTSDSIHHHNTRYDDDADETSRQDFLEAESTILRRTLDKERHVVSELVDFRSKAVDHLRSQNSIIEHLKSTREGHFVQLAKLSQRARWMKQDLASLRRAGMALRRAVRTMSADIVRALTGPLQLRAKQIKSQIGLRHAYRSAKALQVRLFRRVLQSSGPLRRTCWVSALSSKSNARGMTIIPNTTVNQVVVVRDETISRDRRFRRRTYSFDAVHGPSASITDDVLSCYDDAAHAVLNGIDCSVLLIWPSAAVVSNSRMSSTNDSAEDNADVLSASALQSVFRACPPEPCAVRGRLRVAAVHNDVVYDLLATTENVRGTDSASYPQFSASHDLTEVEITRAQDVHVVYNMAIRRRDILSSKHGWSYVHTVAKMRVSVYDAFVTKTINATLGVANISMVRSRASRQGDSLFMSDTAPFATERTTRVSREDVYLSRSHASLFQTLRALDGKHRRVPRTKSSLLQLLSLNERGSTHVVARVDASKIMTSSFDVIGALDLVSKVDRSAHRDARLNRERRRDIPDTKTTRERRRRPDYASKPPRAARNFADDAATSSSVRREQDWTSRYPFEADEDDQAYLREKFVAMGSTNTSRRLHRVRTSKPSSTTRWRQRRVEELPSFSQSRSSSASFGRSRNFRARRNSSMFL